MTEPIITTDIARFLVDYVCLKSICDERHLGMSINLNGKSPLSLYRPDVPLPNGFPMLDTIWEGNTFEGAIIAAMAQPHVPKVS